MSFVSLILNSDALIFAYTGHIERKPQQHYREDLKQHITLTDDNKLAVNKLLKLMRWCVN